MKNQKINGLTGILLFLSLLLIALPLSLALAPTDDYATGSFTLNAQPSVASVDFQTDAYVTDEALDPVTVYQRLNFTVTHSGTFDDILNCTIWIFDDSTHGSDYNTTAEDGIFLVQFLWVEATDTWSVSDQGSMSEWDVDSATSDDPGTASSETTFEFSMRFNISQVARAEAGDWNATIHVYDDDGGGAEWGAASEGTLVTMNNYFSVLYSTRTFTWGSDIQPNSDNNTHGALTMTAYANAAWEMRINATDFNTSGESDVDIEANDILTWDQDGSNGGNSSFIRNTIATLIGTWDEEAAMSDENGLNRNVYYFLSPGAFFIVGKEWNTTVTIWIQADS